MTMFTVRGTNSGDLLGVPPTNRGIEYTMIEIDTVEGGQIVKTWTDFHPVRVLQQLGLIVGKE